MNPILPPSRKTKTFYRMALRNILACIMNQASRCQAAIKLLSRLSKVEIWISLDKVLIKERELLCFKCRQIFSNRLVFILHLELIHNDEIAIPKYEFDRNKLLIHVDSKGISHPAYILQEENHLVLVPSQNRIISILDSILNKFTNRRSKKGKRTYYHSNNIFQQIGSSSEEQDSENEAGYIERDLQKHRINQFSDVSEKDKSLFNTWNDLVHQAKKVTPIIDHSAMLSILGPFARECKRQGIKRINFFTHVWTLWSAGKISSLDVNEALRVYDRNQ